MEVLIVILQGFLLEEPVAPSTHKPIVDRESDHGLLNVKLAT